MDFHRTLESYDKEPLESAVGILLENEDDLDDATGEYTIVKSCKYYSEEYSSNMTDEYKTSNYGMYLPEQDILITIGFIHHHSDDEDVEAELENNECLAYSDLLFVFNKISSFKSLDAATTDSKYSGLIDCVEKHELTAYLNGSLQDLAQTDYDLSNTLAEFVVIPEESRYSD